MRTGGFTTDVLAALADVATELQFEIHCPTEARPLEFVVDADHRKTVALVVDGLLVEGFDHPVIGASVHRLQGRFRILGTQRPGATGRGETLAQVQFEAGAIAHLRWRLDR
ncbi:hypothetical protein D3C87_1653960 [compost metagenome]